MNKINKGKAKLNEINERRMNERKVKAKKIKEIRSTPPIYNIEKKKEKQKVNKRTKERTKRKQIKKIETYLECRQTKTPTPKKKQKVRKL